MAEICVPWIFLSDAERRISSSAAGLLVACVPLVGALLVRFTGRREEHLGPRRLAGLGVGLLGVAALVGLDVSVQDGWALAEMVLVVIGYAVGPIVVSRDLSDLPSLEVVAVSLARRRWPTPRRRCSSSLPRCRRPGCSSRWWCWGRSAPPPPSCSSSS